MALQLQLCIFNLYTNWVVKIYKRKLTKMGPGGQNVVLEVNYRQRLCLRLLKGNLRALHCSAFWAPPACSRRQTQLEASASPADFPSKPPSASSSKQNGSLLTQWDEPVWFLSVLACPKLQFFAIPE